MRRRPPLHRLIAAIAPVAVAAVMPALVPAAAAAAPEACRADPLGGRPLYLRGSFNGWTADDRHRFTWACDRHELVATLSGEHRFKLGDEAWSADADFGAAPAGAADAPLAPRGRELLRRFDGTYRFVLRWPAPGASDTPGVVSTATPGTGTSPRLVVNDCPAPPLPAVTQLYLRGTMNNWGVVEDQAFLYQCDGYSLLMDSSLSSSSTSCCHCVFLGPSGGFAGGGAAGFFGSSSANLNVPAGAAGASSGTGAKDSLHFGHFTFLPAGTAVGVFSVTPHFAFGHV